MEQFQKIRNYLKSNLTSHRYEHSLRVEKTSIKLAQKFNLSVSVCALAGLAHDICREFSPGQLQSETGRLHANPVLLHGEAGAIVIQKLFGIKDLSVLNAIKYHTSGSVDMDDIGKIIFSADYMEPGRKHLSSGERDRLSLLELDDMVLEIALKTREHLQLKNLLVEPEMEKLIEKFNKDVH